MNRQASLPRRPLTIGELLDAAAGLVRRRAIWLLTAAAALAALEQAVLHPLRVASGVDLIDGFQSGFWETFGGLWVSTAIGFGFEAFIITMLGPWAGQIAAADLTGTWARPRFRFAVLLTAPVAGIATAVGAFLGPLWVLGYTLFGLSGAVIGVERRGPFGALGRAVSLAFPAAMRVTGARLLGYLAWLLLRLGFTVGVLSLFEYLPVGQIGVFWVLTIGFVVANAAAYAFLAALDAAALIEVRFRTEGLDIWLARAERHAPLTAGSLAGR